MLNTILIGTVATLLVGAAPSPQVQADTFPQFQGACPHDHPALRQRVVNMLSNPAIQSVRQRDGWDVDPTQLRVLTDATDASVCQLLRDNIQHPDPVRITSYYKVGGLYFVATERTTVLPPGHMILSRSEPLLVLRSDLSLIGSYSN